jgi:predicted ATP-binding protein involved in virulence
MHIKHITVKNFRCFEHLEFDLNSDVNIFVGNNGSGKSAVLDAIAAAMFYYLTELQVTTDIRFLFPVPVSQSDFPVPAKDNQEKKQIELAVLTKDFPVWSMGYNKPSTGDNEEKLTLKSFSSRQRVSSELKNKFVSLKNDLESELCVIAYYKSDRNLKNSLNLNLKTISNQSFNRFNSLDNALDVIANFTDLINWFFIREFEELRQGKSRGDINYELPDLKQVRNAIKTIIHPEARVYCTQTTSIKLMVEWTMETGEKRELTLNQLSAGYRNMLALECV